MPTHNQIITETPITVNTIGPGLSTTSTANLHLAFPASPMYNDYTDKAVKDLFTALVLSPVVNDGGHTFGEFRRDFHDAPDVSTIQTGGGGLPGTPWAPNIASPGPGANPHNIPESGAAATLASPHGGGAFNGDGLASPSVTSNKIATRSRKLGDYIFGKSFAR